MSGKCSICLSSFTEPVSIPCGHVYCTQCLADHVNAPGGEDTTASCPTCRYVFSTVTPDLTYLPKKYHQYVIPSVRRIYIDISEYTALEKKFAKAEKRIGILEKNQQALREKCAHHISVARKHAEEERISKINAEELEAELEQVTLQANRDRLTFENEMEKVRAQCDTLTAKYEKLKTCRTLVTRSDAGNTEPHPVAKRRKSKSSIESSNHSIRSVEPMPNGSDDKRRVRPLPRSRVEQAQPAFFREHAVSPPPHRNDRPKRQRLSPSTPVQRSFFI